MTTLLCRLLALAACLFVPASLHAQTGDEPGELRVFLDCDACDTDYLRTELPWLAFMRERRDADVHVLVTSLVTGAGGREYTLTLIGLREPTRSDTLRFVSRPNEASASVRSGLARTIQFGLMPWVLRTPQAERITLSFQRADSGSMTPVMARDPWNAWVLNVRGRADLEKEQRQSETEFFGSFSANRVTDRLKIGISADGELNRDQVEFERDGALERRVAKREEFGSGVVVIKSLGPHWGAGAQASASSSTFQNIRLAVRAAPAVEYSVWPYAEATRRQLTLQYSLGVASYRYAEQTIFDRLSEVRPTQSFIVGYDVQQPWGEAELTLETAAFLDNLKQYRVELSSEIDIRLFRGFSLSLGAGASLLRDQIAIVKDQDPDDVLQELRELLTDFRYELRAGFSYSFGSIFNSVVNPRFGSGTGQILR